VVLRKREEEAEKADAKSDRIMMSLYKNPDDLLAQMQDDTKAQEIIAALSEREKGDMLLELARRQNAQVERE
ncbi:MAG: hypothetical protein H7175_00895, partial [Burkholderiales bacterium]|nr:hypothetical protein [Anaerolineae bacterium]